MDFTALAARTERAANEDDMMTIGEAIEIHEAGGEKKSLLLHCCCAPCASHCLSVATSHFEVTCFFYNPNITDREEYFHRLAELERFVKEAGYDVEVIDGGFAPEAFYEMARGRENLPEGGARCLDCYALRLAKTREIAEKGHFCYFATTLTVSPHKRSEAVNRAGAACENGGSVYLASDFKKKNGYAHSIELSRQYGLYRQNYCGCEYSRNKCFEKKSEEEK